jgi:hypothetical protein
MPRLVGFGWFAALLEEQISEEIGRRILSCDNGGGPIEHWPVVHVEPHSHAKEQIVWMLNGKRFRLGSEQRVCSQGDVVASPVCCCRGEPPAA